MIIQNVGHDGTTNLGFTIPQDELESAKKVIEDLHPSDYIEYDSSIAKVSIVGVGMKSHSGVASSAFSALAQENINIQMISTSEIKISMAIDEKYSELAVRTLHSAYELDK
jgi:aspartate kinase